MSQSVKSIDQEFYSMRSRILLNANLSLICASMSKPSCVSRNFEFEWYLQYLTFFCGCLKGSRRNWLHKIWFLRNWFKSKDIVIRRKGSKIWRGSSLRAVVMVFSGVLESHRPSWQMISQVRPADSSRESELDNVKWQRRPTHWNRRTVQVRQTCALYGQCSSARKSHSWKSSRTSNS